MSRLGDILNTLADMGYKEYEQTVSGTMSQWSTTAPLSSFYYLGFTRPSEVPEDAIAEVKSTNKQCWVLNMTGANRRLMSIGSGSITATIVWKYRVS